MEHNEILKMILLYHSQGLNDTDVGLRIGLSREQSGFYRRKLGLSINSYSKTLKLKEKIIELNNMGLNDKEIGKILNKNHRTIFYHRRRLNLLSPDAQISYKNEYDRIRGYIIRNTKFMAKRRNIDFNLTFEDFELPDYCPLLNIKLTYRNESNGNNFSHATLDRIDNSKGYIKGNIMIISRLANSMKNEANFEQLATFCKNILTLINNYKNQGALGSITDVFPDIKLKEI